MRPREELSLLELARRSGLSPTSIVKYRKLHVVEHERPGAPSKFTGRLGKHVVRRGLRLLFRETAIEEVRKLRDEGSKLRGTHAPQYRRRLPL